MHFRIKNLGWDMVKELYPMPGDPVEREHLLEKLFFLKRKEEEFAPPDASQNGQAAKQRQGAYR